MPPPYHFSSGQSDDANHQESNLLISTKGEPQSQIISASIKAMDEHGGPKVNGIRQIVRLKELLQKWQNVTLNSRLPNNHQHGRPHPGGISPDVNSRLKSAVTACDSDEEGCPSPDSPPDVPKGYLAVYVGPEVRRFIIPTAYLSHNLFKVLLEKAEEEFGFDHGGGLTLPCEIETFKYLLNCIENENMNKEGHPTDIAEGSATEA